MRALRDPTTWLILAALITLALTLSGITPAQAQDERTVIYNGVTIILPADADLCVYDKRCVWGFTVEGTFPGLLYRDAIRELLHGNGLVLEYPLCERGLIVSPAVHVRPCYDLLLE